jgi:ABC-type dipeptide/oligopeptide/nickel transport system permease subunit
MSIQAADPAIATAFADAEAAVARRRRRLAPPGVCLALFVLAAIVLFAVAPAIFAPENPDRIDPAAGLQPPSSEHLLGTDQLGRDVLSRVIHGSRSALLGPLLVGTTTLLIATALALAAGYFRGRVDAAISRVIDVLYSLPSLIVAIVVVGVFGGGYWLAIATLIVLGLPANVRLIRAGVIEQRFLPYVEAAQVQGLSSMRIMFRHVLPNIAPVILAAFFLRFTYGIVDLSSLSFLGLGVPPGSPDWGRMLAENRVTVFQNAWGAIVPGLMLVMTAVSANLVGDWLYQRFEERRRAR